MSGDVEGLDSTYSVNDVLVTRQLYPGSDTITLQIPWSQNSHVPQNPVILLYKGDLLSSYNWRGQKGLYVALFKICNACLFFLSSVYSSSYFIMVVLIFIY